MLNLSLFKLLLILFVCFLIIECNFYPPPSTSYPYHKHHQLDKGAGKRFDNFFENEGAKFLCYAFGICAAFYPPPASAEKPGFSVIKEWPLLDFDYASESDRQIDIDNGAFTPGTPAPIDVDVHYAPSSGSRIFVSVPRFQLGCPATLGIVSNKVVGNRTLITPYPSWDWHTNPTQCKRDRLISVYRMQIDECGRLWVIDTGRHGDSQTCPPQIIAFDLQNNKVLHRYEIPASQIESRSILVTAIVDIRDPQGSCEDTFVYVADCQTYSIIVYDVKRDTSWKATDKTMYPYPNQGTYSIQGDSFDLMDGVLGMSLSPYFAGQERYLYYHAMSSKTENWVKTSDLKNQTRFMHNPESSPEVFHTLSDKRNTQSAAEAMDKDGIMYFGTMSDVSINCWNTQTAYGNYEPVAQNSKTLQFASGMKVIKNPKNVLELWVLTSRFQKIGAGTLTAQEINFRILAGKIDDLVFGTRCRKGQRIHGAVNSGGGGYGFYKPNHH